MRYNCSKVTVMNKPIPVFFVTDIDLAISLYCNRVGFEVKWEHFARDSSHEHTIIPFDLCPLRARIAHGDCEIEFLEVSERQTGKTIRIETDDIERITADCRILLGTDLPIHKTAWGTKEAHLKDPWGNRIEFVEYLGDPGMITEMLPGEEAPWETLGTFELEDPEPDEGEEP